MEQILKKCDNLFSVDAIFLCQNDCSREVLIEFSEREEEKHIQPWKKRFRHQRNKVPEHPEY